MILENKLKITDQAELAREEERISKTRAKKMFETGYLNTLEPGTFESLKKIHKYLFEEIYEFAGNLRKVNIAKGKTITGTVIRISSKGEIFVDFQYKSDGIIPKREYSDDETKNKPILFSDLADLLRSSYTSDEVWFIYKTLLASFEFSLDENSLKNGIIQFIPCSQEEIELQQKKLYEKEHEAEIRNEFLARLKQKQLNLPDDAKFMVEVPIISKNNPFSNSAS